MERKTISYNNSRISYERGGSGPALVLLHGFGEDHQVWKHQAACLQQHYLVITPDIPGSGDSELLTELSMESIADVVEAIAQAEKLDQLALIGHSMGGYVTLAYAARYANRLRAFGLFHSTASADNEEKIGVRRKGMAFIEKYGAQAFLDLQPGNLFAPATLSDRPEIPANFKSSNGDFSEEALIAYYEAMIARSDRTAVLKESQVPVLFILGVADALIPLEATLEQASLPPVAQVALLEKSGHMGMLEEPEEACRILKDFLSGLRPA